MRERTEPYKEDSTKGSSLINPLNYKGDVLVQVWMDSRVLATLASWLEKNGIYARFMSQVVRRPLEVLTGHLVDSDQVEMIDDTNEARRLLEQRFQVNLNKGGHGGKNVLHNQILTDKRTELAEKLKDGSRFVDAQRPVVKGVVDPEIIKKAMEIFNSQTSEDLEKMRADAIEAAKADGTIVEGK